MVQDKMNEYLESHPLIRGIIAVIFGLGIIIYSLRNIRYSENRTKNLKKEVLNDESKYFNLGLMTDLKWRAIISILMGTGLILYGIVVIIENIF